MAKRTLSTVKRLIEALESAEKQTNEVKAIRTVCSGYLKLDRRGKCVYVDQANAELILATAERVLTERRDNIRERLRLEYGLYESA
jgi:predicted DNA-binding ribbon-helix-helix protein